MQFPNVVIIFAKKIKDYDLKQRLMSRNEQSTPGDIQMTENIQLEDNQNALKVIKYKHFKGYQI